jgi:hypothetical protein
LDLHLKDPEGRVAGLDVDDGELVVEGLALVVGVEKIDLGNRCGESLWRSMCSPTPTARSTRPMRWR